MKILFVIRELEIGGAQRQLSLLANSLAARGHEPVIAVFYGGGKIEADLHEGVRLICLDKKHRWDLLSFLHRMLRLIAQERPDVVHGYMSGGNLCATLARISWRKAKIVWGMRASEFDPKSGDVVSRIVDRIESRLSYVPDRIIVNSAAGMRYCNQLGFRRKSLVLVPNAIDAEKYFIDPSAGKRVRAEWGIADSEHLIGLIGRLDPMKGHSIFLAAAAQLKASHRNLRFVCLGNGPQPYREEMHALARRLGLKTELQWLDARIDMRAVYNAIDVVCSSSVYGEGFPNVVGEAMACGRPCVVTDVGDSGFVVGDTQVVVSAGDPVALASAIIDQSVHPSSSSETTRQRIVANFSVTRLTENTESILDDLLQSQPESVDPPARTAAQSKQTAEDAANRA